MNEVEEKIFELPVANIAGALAEAQSLMMGAKKDKKNPFYKSSYADMASAVAAIREPFSENGLSVSQTMDYKDGVTLLRTRLMHVSGEFLDSVMSLPIDSNPQKTGSNITYYRRYMLMAICNLAPVEDDANSVSPIAPRNVKQLESMLKDHPAIREQVLQHCQGNMLNFTLDRFPGLVQWINEQIEEVSNG